MSISSSPFNLIFSTYALGGLPNFDNSALTWRAFNYSSGGSNKGPKLGTPVGVDLGAFDD
jgi:hypothetical protein